MKALKPLVLAAAVLTLTALPNTTAHAGERGALHHQADRQHAGRYPWLYDPYREEVRRDRRGRAERFDGFERHARRPGRCRPRRALRKARRLGLRRAYIHRAGPRGVVIRGRAHGERLAIRFGRASFCPVRNVRVRGWRR